MKFTLLPMTALALAMALSSCGKDEAADNNIIAEDVNAVTSVEELPPAEPATNAAAEAPAEPAEPKAVEPTKPEAAKPAPAPTKPKATEPAAPAPACAPEHRAAGHC